MDLRLYVFSFYIALGLIMLLLNKQVTEFCYKLTLYVTEKLNLQDLFFFKMTEENKDSMHELFRALVILFGGLLFTFSALQAGLFQILTFI